MKTKAFTLVEIMIVIVIISLLAAMAIPAFEKVKAASIEKNMTQQIQIISVETGKVIIQSPLKKVLEQDESYVKWLDTDDTLHKQPLGKNFTFHIQGRSPKR